MSTGYECNFYVTVDGKHYYLLQNWDCPIGAWDWREWATAYGPFTTAEEAERHLFANHANPGGFWEAGHPIAPGDDELLDKLFEKARR